MTRLFRSILTITLLTLIATISFAQDSSGIRNVIRFQSHYIIRALVISGNYAYCALGNNGICVVDVTNPNTPREIGYCTTPGCAVGIAISGNYAFVADSSFGIRVIDISDISNLYEISSLPTNAKGIRVSGGYAYVITYLNQFEMIDISSPYSLQIVSTLNVNGEISGFEINRGFAYIAALSAGLRIIDIRDSTNIFETGSYVPVPTYAKCVTVRGDTVYLGDYDGSYLREIDVSTPSSPRQTRSFQLTGDEFNSINQVSVLGDYAYLGCSSGGSYGYGHTTWWHYSLFTLTVRISNPDSIFEVGGHEYGYFSGSDYSGEGGSSYSSGSSYGIVTDIKAFGNQVYTAYGDHCIIIENTFNTTPVHGTALYWSFQYTTVTGNIVYVADNNTLRLFNISNPSHPSNLSTYSTRGNIKKVEVRDSLAFIFLAGNNTGFQVLNIASSSNIYELRYYPFHGTPLDFAENGSYGFVLSATNNIDSLFAFGLNDSSNTLPVSSVSLPGVSYGICCSGNNVFIANASHGVRRIDFTNAATPFDRGCFGNWASVVCISGNYAFIGAGAAELRKYDISNLSNITLAASIATSTYARHLVMQSGHLFASFDDSVFAVFDAASPTSLNRLGFYHSREKVWNLSVSNNLIFTADSTEMGIYDCSQALGVVDRTSSSVPEHFSLKQNYPNPFNSSTTIEYTIPKTGKVEMKLYDITGRAVGTLVNFNQNPGTYRVKFDGTKLASGIYFCRLNANELSETKKLTILK